MRLYLAVPTYLMELFVKFFTLSWQLKDGTFCPCLSYLASFFKSIRENMITMILWFLNIRHSSNLFGMWFFTSAQQIFLLILPSKG
jgi:hypothetical protein